MSVTQLVNPDIDRVDAVNGPATGLPFLMFKSLDAPVKAEPEEALAVDVAKATCPSECAETHPGKEHETVVKSAEEAPVEEATPAEDVAKSAEEAPTEEAPAPAEEVAKSDEEAFKTWKAAQAPTEDAAPVVEVAAPAEEVAKSSEEVAPVVEVAAPAEEVAKSTGHLPSGLQEILDTFVESYVRYKEAMASGAAAEMAASGTVEEHLAPTVASADIPVAPAAPEVPVAEEAPAAEVNAPPAEAEKPAEAAPHAPEHHEQPKAHEEPPAAAEAPAEAPAEEDPHLHEEEKPDFPPKKKAVAKSMDELIAEAVSKAIAEAQEPLLKKIDILERTPVDSGPMFAGQTPGNAGNPLLGRGQAEGDPAQGLVNKSAGAQAAPGAYALAEALKGVHLGKL